MTIKEMEQFTGMSRANIRFYETEGLITPQRKENGYRDYSTQDGEVLLKIRLLRTMDMPLEEIKRLQAGTESLAEALTRHLHTLSQKQTQLERSRLVTRELLAAGVEYGGLDALRYLQALEGQEEKLRGDVTPRHNLPWRRFWARDLDMMLYGLLVSWLLRGFLLRDSLTALLTLVAMLLLEPLLLKLFGTTPGKAIFGIWVTDTEEGRLSYARGLERTWMVLWEGMALNIPVLGWYFQYKSYQTADSGGELPWEQDLEITYQDDRMWRYGLYAAVYALVWALSILNAIGG